MTPPPFISRVRYCFALSFPGIRWGSKRKQSFTSPCNDPLNLCPLYDSTVETKTKKHNACTHRHTHTQRCFLNVNGFSNFNSGTQFFNQKNNFQTSLKTHLKLTNLESAHSFAQSPHFLLPSCIYKRTRSHAHTCMHIYSVVSVANCRSLQQTTSSSSLPPHYPPNFMNTERRPGTHATQRCTRTQPNRCTQIIFVSIIVSLQTLSFSVLVYVYVCERATFSAQLVSTYSHKHIFSLCDSLLIAFHLLLTFSEVRRIKLIQIKSQNKVPIPHTHARSAFSTLVLLWHLWNYAVFVVCLHKCVVAAVCIWSHAYFCVYQLSTMGF